MKTTAPVIAAALAAAVPAAAQQEEGRGARLVVVVTGVDPGVGLVAGGLYGDAAGYDAAMHSRGESDPIESAEARVGPDGRARLVFDRLAAGDYAVVVRYDRNGDGKLNLGLLGIPREKVGFSNNARARFSAPSWENVRFEVGDEGGEITIRVERPGPA